MSPTDYQAWVKYSARSFGQWRLTSPYPEDYQARRGGEVGSFVGVRRLKDGFGIVLGTYSGSGVTILGRKLVANFQEAWELLTTRAGLELPHPKKF